MPWSTTCSEPLTCLPTPGGQGHLESHRSALCKLNCDFTKKKICHQNISQLLSSALLLFEQDVLDEASRVLSSFCCELCTPLDASHSARGWGTSSREPWNQAALDGNAFPPPWKHIWNSYSEQHALLGGHKTPLCSRNQQLEKGTQRSSSLGRENPTTSG